MPILLGTGSNDTAYGVTATRRAADLGVDGVLVVTPYYNRPSQQGLEAHFRAVAAATELPVVLYDIPVRTGRKISTELLVRLVHEVPNIVALKDAAGDPAETARLVAACPDDFEVYSGDDPLTLPLLAIGAVGVISVASHWVGRQLGEMVAAYEKGDVDDGASHQRRPRAPPTTSRRGDDAPNPIPTKAMLRVLGLHVGQCRLPLGPAPDGLEDRARSVLESLS